MAFIKLNGITIDVEAGSPKRSISRVGSSGRSFNGQLIESFRGRRRQHEMRACFDEHDKANALIKMINGEGHVFPFVDGFDALTGLQAVHHDISHLKIISGASPFSDDDRFFEVIDDGIDVNAFSIDAQLVDDWTIGLWVKELGLPWTHIVNRSDGRAFLDGIESDFFWQTFNALEIRVVNGALKIKTTGDPSYFSEMIVLPYRASVDQIAAMANPKRWGNNPELRLTGDVITTDEEIVLGEVKSVDYVSYSDDDGVWHNNSIQFSFILKEVATLFKKSDDVKSQGSVVPDDAILALDPLIYWRPEDLGPIGTVNLAKWINRGSMGAVGDGILVGGDSIVTEGANGFPQIGANLLTYMRYYSFFDPTLTLSEQVFGVFTKPFPLPNASVPIENKVNADYSNGYFMLRHGTYLRIGVGSTAPSFSPPITGESRFVSRNNADLSKISMYVNGIKRADPSPTAIPQFEPAVGAVRTTYYVDNAFSCLALFPAGTDPAKVAAAFEERFA